MYIHMSTGVKIFGWEALYFSSEFKFIRILRLNPCSPAESVLWESMVNPSNPTHTLKFMDGVIYLTNMGLSENSVPLNPMVNDHYPY